MAESDEPAQPVGQSRPPSSSARIRKLPSRLFATDRYPDGRVNVYSRPDILTVARKVLQNTSQWDKLINSQFGCLFTLPVGRCPHYGQLLHALVSRQLITRKKYEMWTVFGGHPLRFSLFEFGSVSGLSCGEFPQGYDYDFQLAPTPGQKYYWHTLIGKDMKTTIADVSKKLQDEPNMDADLKLKLVLLLIVDGILIATLQTHRPTLKYVEMLEDVDKFLAFPWGRESFLKTIATLKAPPARSAKEEGVKSFVQQLKQQQTFRAQGFPLALQLLALQNISGLLPNTLAASEPRNFLQWPFVGIPKHSFSRADVHAVEREGSLSVDPLVYVDLPPEKGWGQWGDEDRDKRVEYMMKLISKGHTFQKSEWIGGDNSLDFINVVEKNPQQVHQKHVIVRKRKVSKNDQSSSNSRNSKRCKSNPPSEIETLKEMMQSQIDDMKQSLSIQLNQHSLEINKLNRKYKYLKFMRAGKFGTNSSFLPYKRLKNKPKNISQQGTKSDEDVHQSTTLDGNSDHADHVTTPPNNSIDDMFNSPLRTNSTIHTLPPLQNSPADIFSGSPAHDWNKYLRDIPTESPDAKGHKQDVELQGQPNHVHRDQTTKDVHLDLNIPQVVSELTSHAPGQQGVNLINSYKPLQVDGGVGVSPILTERSSEGTTNPVDYISDPNSRTPPDEDDMRGDQGVVDVLLALPHAGSEDKSEATITPVANIPEETKRIPPLEADIGGDMGNVSTSPELAIGKQSLFDTMGQPISVPATKHNPFEDFIYEQIYVNSDDPIYDTVTKKFSIEAESVQNEGNDTLHAVGTHSPGDPIYDTATKKLPFEAGSPQIQFNYTAEANYLNHSLQVQSPNANDTLHEKVGSPVENATDSLQAKVVSPKQQPNYTLVEVKDNTHSLEVESPDKNANDSLKAKVVSHCDQGMFTVEAVGNNHTSKDEQTTTNTLQGTHCQEAATTTNLLDGNVDLVELSDSSPARARETLDISEAEKKLIAHFLSKPKLPSYHLLPTLDVSEFCFFEDTLISADNTKHLTRGGYEIDNLFILQLAQSQNWVSTTHMEVLVSLLSTRLQHTLRTQRAAFAPPWIANHLQGKYRSFKAARFQKPMHWPDMLISLCNTPGATWYDDIDTVYLPMCWAGKHWVGLAINLGVWSVEILDPNNDHYDLKDVARFVAPVVEMLPHFIKDHCILPLSQTHGLQPFVWNRVEGIYKNLRSGDCGPVAMKFLEIEASESRHDKMVEITDEIVDEFRRQYAMDVYAEFVAPIYNS